MKRVLLVVVAALGVGAALAGTSSAAQPTACGLVTAAEYAKVIGHPVRLTPGEGSSSCNVRSGSTWIVPNLNPYNAAYVKRMLGTMKSQLTRVPQLGSMGYVLSSTDGSITSYAAKGSWFIAFQGEHGVTKQQAIKLASIALSRL